MINFINIVLSHFDFELIRVYKRQNTSSISKFTLLPHNERTITLLNIEFDLNLINITPIAKASGFSHTYCRRLLNGEKKNPKALWKLRNTIVKLYGSLIKDVHYDLKLSKKKAA